MHDAHFHVSKSLLNAISGHGVEGIANAASKAEYERLKQYSWFVSAGIHPWYVDQTDWDEMYSCLEDAPIIGEIGMDNTWCTTDQELQKRIFEKQLIYASAHKKPVILHTKGLEVEVYDLIRNYPNTYLVHWYSSMEGIQEYVDLGCYFTIGPSIGLDEAVDEVCRRCPMDRLLLETDGIEAIAWAYDCKEEEVSYERALQRSVEKIAKIKGMECREMEAQLDRNFKRFVNNCR